MFLTEVAEASLLFLALVALAAYLDRRDARQGRWPVPNVLVVRRTDRTRDDLAGEPTPLDVPACVTWPRTN